MRTDLDVNEFDKTFFAHYGTPRHSGRYPFGSGDDSYQRHTTFLNEVTKLRKQGLSSVEIAKGMGLGDHGTAQLRARTSIAKNEVLKARQTEALKLKEKGVSNVAIGKHLGIPEPTVRSLLQPARQEKANSLNNTADFLKKQIEEKEFLDVGAGTEHYISGVSRTQLNNAVTYLREQGYTFHYVKVTQLGTGKETKLKVLAAPGVSYKEVVTHPEKIKTIQGYSEDRGKNVLGIEKPTDVPQSRIQVNYKDTGGNLKDGVIELRRGVEDISLGAARYAQVRISVEGTHYLKGMAMYADDLPDGVDMRFNTNKTRAEAAATAKKKGFADPELGALKPQSDDEDNPFGAIIRQKHYIDKDGNRKLSPINIVGTEDVEGIRHAGEEGGWAAWSKSLSSQVLSKQTPALAKRQLDLAYKSKVNEYDEIMSLTNPAVRKKLLESFADGADASAVHLKAAYLPKQATHVILPMNSMKETEVYAPQYRDGEKVALIRYPHGGIFEIPELTVNNRAAEPNRLIKNAKDAIGINAKVAERLSGADFDGDTVLVIPNTTRALKTKAPLDRLQGFDPQTEYAGYEGMPKMSARSKQRQMGDVSNLITDMTIKGANWNEIANAVRHSMVVIDAEKHNLNWRKSAQDHGISALKERYQGKSDAGAATLVSRATSSQRVDNRRPQRVYEDGGVDPKTGERLTVRTVGAIDPATGKKLYTPTGEGYVKPAYTRVSKTGKVTEVPAEAVTRQFKSTKLAETDDAFTLVSDNPTVMETVYAEHSNKLKALANTARKSYLQTPNLTVNQSAKGVYAPQVDTLKAKLNIALKNSPLERQAQLMANSIVKMKQQDEPDMDAAKLKKIKGQSLTEARARMGAKKERVQITDIEWNAIQAGAISNNFLNQILANTDLDRIKELATPRNHKGLSTTQVALAKARLNSGFTQAEVADSLGISTSTLNAALK